MVQFSLKLEDNRVEKWSSHYLDYRKLKKTIKQLTRSQNALNCRRYLSEKFLLSVLDVLSCMSAVCPAIGVCE